MEEDILLAEAWLNTGLDPIQGNSQKRTKFGIRFWRTIMRTRKKPLYNRLRILYQIGGLSSKK
jgi:hypothetical protein